MHIMAIALKDLIRALRSAFFLGMALGAPLALTGIMYFAFAGISVEAQGLRLATVNVGVVNADSLPDLATEARLEAPLGDNLRAMFFDPSVSAWLQARDYPDEAAARAALDRQEIGVALIIPADFTAHYLSGEQDRAVRLLSDPTLTNAPALVEEMVTMMMDGVTGGGIALQTLIERQQARGNPPPNPAHISNWLTRYTDWYQELQRDLFHRPEQAALRLVTLNAGEGQAVNALQQTISLVLAGQMIFFAFFTGAYAMLSILREEEEGTLARLFTAPVSRTYILGGKLLAVVLTVSLQSLVILLGGRLAFGVDWGQPAAVCLALTGQVLAASGLGVLLIAFVKTSRQGGPVLGGGLTVLGMLGGLFTANIPGGMPEAFKALAYFTPQGWALEAWELSLTGADGAAVLPAFALLMLLGGGMFTVGALLFKRRYA